MILDMHCHYTFCERRAAAAPRFSFEPGCEQSPDALDSFIAPRKRDGIVWRLWQRVLGIDPRRGRARVGSQQGELARLDAELALLYERHLLAPGPIDRYVLLAFDAYHASDGSCPSPGARRGQLGSDIYTSNSLIRETCRARGDRFLFGASVHPYRARAVECVEEVFAGGACLLKWLPLNQNIDARDARTIAVLRCCAALRMPVLVHYNEEFTLTTQHPEHRPIGPMLETLRELRARGDMPPMIFAHAATPASPWGRRADYHALRDALAGEFRDAPIYADVSALATLGKSGYLSDLLRRQHLHRKLLFGSDFPVPVLLWRLKRELRGAYDELRREPSWPQRAARAMLAAGLHEATLHRAAEILPNVERFARH